ncbi:hypothetical protein BGZ51_001414 [Haplosporangium sp. Z 767]|nr:hypothetical protein BGZ51_001414 [Haplosporangium sp. Z 767]
MLIIFPVARALIGVSALHIPTPRMLRVFSKVLDDLVPSVRLPAPNIDDSAVMAAVRMDKLPRKADKTLAEGPFVADYVPTLSHGASQHRVKALETPRIKADRPDVVVKVRGHEVFFGEVTDLAQASNISKCTWDTFKLTRFAKSFLENGNDIAPVIQMIYTSGSYLRLYVKARGMFFLEEVGCFEAPSSISRTPSLVATLPTLLVTQGDLIKILQSNSNERRRSWGFKVLPGLKRRVNT